MGLLGLTLATQILTALSFLITPIFKIIITISHSLKQRKCSQDRFLENANNCKSLADEKTQIRLLGIRTRIRTARQTLAIEILSGYIIITSKISALTPEHTSRPFRIKRIRSRTINKLSIMPTKILTIRTLPSRDLKMRTRILRILMLTLITTFWTKVTRSRLTLLLLPYLLISSAVAIIRPSYLTTHYIAIFAQTYTSKI